ncbi:MAG: RelA/SpoT domain-containing protein [Patescibacteria group bacterium]|nr:RelA/SpoT domain-containing protein [Patescibacteria group bacterium]
MKKTTQRLIEEYKIKRNLYEDFSKAMYGILNSLLNDKGYKFQITSRTKELASLEKKVNYKSKFYKKLSDVEDLSGIRIVFYLESDIGKFIADLRKEINGDLKVEKNNKQNGYKATHLIFGLAENRVSLAEYSKYAGLKCEVQLTQILYHAWSEIEHDIFYKTPPELEKLDKKIVTDSKKEMKNAMDNYLSNAAGIFEKVVSKLMRKKVKSPNNNVDKE